jgi:hypothetical protein
MEDGNNDNEMDTISYDQSAHIKLNLDLNIKDKVCSFLQFLATETLTHTPDTTQTVTPVIP